MITILTVGYGDIVPVTDNEKVFVIVMSLITSGVFGYTINSIGGIFKDIEERKEKTKNRMSLITSYLKRNNISKHLLLRVKKYFEYYY